MAQMPTIASTAARSLLPTADLQIGGGSPAAFGAAVGEGLQQIGDAGGDASRALAGFQLAKQREAERLAEFDRQAQFVSFGSSEAERLANESRDLSGPAQDFTKTFMGTFDQNAAAWLEKVPQQHKAEWQAKFAQLRAGFAGDALKTEFGQRDAWSKDTLNTALGTLQNSAAQSPSAMSAYEAQGISLINSSLLGAQDKAEAITRWKANVALAAAAGDVERDPHGAIARLGGVDHVTALEAAGKIGGGANAPAHGGGTAAFVDPLRGRGGAPVPGGRYGAGRDYGAHQGTDFTGARGTPVMSGAGGGVATVSHSEKGGNIVTIDHGGGVVTRYMHLDKVDVRNGQRVTGDTVLGNLGMTGRASGPHLHYEVIVNGRHVDPTGLAGKPTPRYDGPTPETASNRPAQPMAAGAIEGAQPEGQPVDPRYANLPFESRMQMIGGAQREIDRREQAQYAAQQAQHENWLNGFMADLLDGKAGKTDIDAARKSGLLTDYNEIASATNIVQQREAQNQALNLYNAVIGAGGQLNPFDSNARKAAEAAFWEQSKVPGVDPMQTALNIWQRSGIMPQAGTVAIRGAMVSTDPHKVAAAASIAANMLQRNPNAFAGVDGGNEIEQNAALYSHYVNDLGMSADQAAQKVAARNAPEMRRKFDVNKPALDAFRTELRKTNVEDVLGAQFGSWFDFSRDPNFTSPEQRGAAAQDYADFALENYEQTGDPAAAKAYALQQMQKVYGVVNGRLMKFPPTKAYPPVLGSHDYIFSQAQGDIKRVTGRDIPVDKIYLMPIPSATAQAFRAGRPVPYSIHYIDKVGGQEVYRTIPGQAFTADVGAAQRAAAGQFGAAQAERRKRDASTRAILRSRSQFGTYN